MLSLLKITNFKSILDMTIDFSYGEGKAPNNYKDLEYHPFLETSNGEKFVPCLSLYGANASGKTNIIAAFLFLQQIIKTGIEGKYVPNKLNHKYNFSRFEIEFFEDKNKFNYGIEYNHLTISKEFLLKNDKELYVIDRNKTNNKAYNFTNITTPEFSENRLDSIVDTECSKFLENGNKVQVLPFINKIITSYGAFNIDLTKTYEYITHSLFTTLDNKLPIRTSLDKILSIYKNDREPSFNQVFTEVTDMLRKFDIGIEKMSLNRESFALEENKMMRIEIRPNYEIYQDNKNKKIEIDHIDSFRKDTEGNEVKFDFLNEESNGTRVLLSILSLALWSLKEGSVLLIDELDRALHPMLVLQIIRMFKDKRYNKKNAQLIFTAHATDVLEPDVFRISEVGIVNKTLKSGSTLKRISDYENIRNVNDFRKLYLNGAFGGLPFPYI